MSAQFGEEGVISTVFPGDFVGFAVDVGAADGRFYSNTVALEQKGWDVLCIEPNKAYNCGQHRKRVLEVAVGAENKDNQDFTVVTMGPHQGYWAACSALDPNPEVLQAHMGLVQAINHIEVDVRTLDWCLENAGFTQLDFASIDTEGGDMDVLRGWDIAKWHPKLIIIENWSGDSRFIDYLKPFGYERMTRLGVNDCFVRQ